MDLATLARSVLWAPWVLGAGLVVSLAVLGFSESAMLPWLMVLVLLGASVPFLLHRVRYGLMFLTILLAPVDIQKAIISPWDKLYMADAPGFWLTPFDLTLAGWALIGIWQQQLKGSHRFRLTGLDWVALLFCGWLWLSAFRSPAGFLALATAATYTKYVLAFVFVSHAVRTEEDWRIVLRAGALILVLQSLWAFAQYATQSPLALPGTKLPEWSNLAAEGGTGFRVFGFFVHPNALADFYVLVLPPALCMLMLGGRVIGATRWWGTLGAFLLGSMALVLTLTRGGWASFALACAVCVFVFWRAGVVPTAFVRNGLITVVLGASLAVATVPQIQDRLFNDNSRSLESRSLLAAQAGLIIRDNWVTGVGFGGYNRASKGYIPDSWADVSPDYQKVLGLLVVHNYYLLLIAEIGLPATLLFIGMLLYLVFSIRPLRFWHDPGRFALATGLAAAIVGNLLFFASDNYYADIRAAMLWLCAGLLQALLISRRSTYTALLRKRRIPVSA